MRYRRLIPHASRATFPRRGRLESNICSHYAEGGLVVSKIFTVWRSRIEHTASDTAEIEKASNVVLAFSVCSKSTVRTRCRCPPCSHYAEGGLVVSRIFAVWRSRIEHTASDTAEIEKASNVVLAFSVCSKSTVRTRCRCPPCSHYAEGGLVVNRIFTVWRSRIEHTASDTAEIEKASNVVLAFSVCSK